MDYANQGYFDIKEEDLELLSEDGMLLSPEDSYAHAQQYWKQAQARADALKEQKLVLAKRLKEDEQNLSVLLKIDNNPSGEASRRLCYIIEKRGLDKSTLARLAGVGRTTIYRYTLPSEHKDFAVPSRKKLLKILDALSVTVHDFCMIPDDFDAWKKEFEPPAMQGRNLFDWRDEVLGVFTKNNFVYEKGGQTVRLTHAQFNLLKSAVESVLGMLDLLPHDANGILADLKRAKKPQEEVKE